MAQNGSTLPVGVGVFEALTGYIGAISLYVRSLFGANRVLYSPLSLLPMRWQDRITSTPEVLNGKPRLKGTRIPVSLVLGYLANGTSVENIQRDLPDVEPEDVTACLHYARDLAEYEVAV